MELKQIVNSFDLNGSVISVNPYGEGHINRTFLVETDKKRYILQKINTALFTDLDKLMHNIVSVTAFLGKKNKGGVNLTVVKTKDGKNYLSTDDGAYRVYEFIENATAYQKADENLFYQSAVAFGKFANDLSDFDASTLYEILPSFHDTNVRFSNFMKAVEEDKMGRAASVKKEIEFYISRKKCH